MVKMIRDNTGRFAERPFYEAWELDNECERLIQDLLLKRVGDCVEVGREVTLRRLDCGALSSEVATSLSRSVGSTSMLQ